MRTIALLLTILLASLAAATNAQVKGSVVNAQGAPIPFASIYVSEQMHGTASDANGRFVLHLKSGSYTVTFKAIGYNPKTQTISIGSTPTNLKVTLEEAIYKLSEVVISNKDNPANRIMRKAISNGQLYLGLLRGYTSDVYFKSSVNFTKFASYIKWIAGKKAELPVEGKTYTMELVNQLEYKAPDRYTQKTKAYRTNFPGGNLDIPGLDIYHSNIYSRTYYDVPSPLGTDAFTCYKFFLVGTSNQNGSTIYKIGVSPRRSGTFYKGFIYIKDGTYEITSAQISTTSSAINLTMNISYDMIKETIPLPTSINTKIDGSFLGNTFKANMLSSVKYGQVDVKATRSVTVEPPKAEAKPKHSARQLKKQQQLTEKIEEISAKDNITLSEMRQLMKLSEKKQELEDTVKSLEEKSLLVVKDSLFNKQDTSFWERIRPVPLTDEEKKYSHESDSITANITAGKVIERKDNNGNSTLKTINNFLTGGTLIQHKFTKLSTSGFIAADASYFNPVDGYTLSPTFTLSTIADSNKRLSISMQPTYSFLRNRMMGASSIKLDIAPRHMGFIKIDGRWGTTDINPSNHISNSLNSISCLYFGESYAKVIDTKSASIKGQIEIVNGLTVGVGSSFGRYSLMNNNSRYSLFDSKTDYASNTPNNIYLDRYPQTNYNQALLSLDISYTPSPRYRYAVMGYKQYTQIKSPTFKMKVVQGMSYWKSSSHFTHLEVGVEQNVEVNLFNTLSYKASAGTFLNTKGMQLSNFYFPTTTYIPFAFEPITKGFALMPYYRYATPSKYAEAHVCYESQRLLVKFLPFLSKSQFSENIKVAYYTTGRYKNYTEVGYWLDKLFFIGGVGVTTRFENGKYSGWGISGYINLSPSNTIQVR